MSDIQNKWVPVSERLPGPTVHKQILLSDGSQAVAFIGGCSGKWTIPCVGTVDRVTHWMDLPEPPTPPKPADPFEAWWAMKTGGFNVEGDGKEMGREAWNAAKEHYAKPSDYMRGCEDASVAISSMVNRILEGKDDGNGRLNDTALEKVRRTLMERLKPQPDFETWWSSDGFSRVNPLGTLKERANGIWNAAQGKPEA